MAAPIGCADIGVERLRELSPKDMIDIQSFLWAQGSGEYDE
jgi:hypothetical protein